eukprot:TRINITY_DN983_c0_g1_i2.p1 TRINITY_DN983_c0_g1~~TRINITY_DN983_c0_g1_i2.p1  ORF type:complete len:192 (+),score=32.70 TRINITY_DN983_c0_g1_i2:5-580(+)
MLSNKKGVDGFMFDIIHLNIGGVKFSTTLSTLSTYGENFFTALVRMPSLRDGDGAYFIDREGKYFEPILHYLRAGVLPDIDYLNITLDFLIKEANFYSIDITPGICDLKEGLYTSKKWILFLEKDPMHPWIYGVTGVEDDRENGVVNAFIKNLCFVKNGVVLWNYNNDGNTNTIIYIFDISYFTRVPYSKK